jgi:YgiT-type zinc finger domain-containing protein
MKRLEIKLSTCPLCASDRIKRVRSDYVLKMGAKTIRIPRLERHECPNCGEKFFDYDATKRIEAARDSRKIKKSA